MTPKNRTRNSNSVNLWTHTPLAWCQRRH